MSARLETDYSAPANGIAEVTPILDHLRSHVTTITPARAQEILDSQNWTRQRTISEDWVGKLRIAMLKGELSFLTLAFAELPDGNRILVDGQHRLKALAQLTRSMDAQIAVHRVADQRELGELYLKYDLNKGRGPEVGLRALGVFENTTVPEKFVRRMGGSVAIINSGFLRGYRQDRSPIGRADAVHDWLPEIEKYHATLEGTSTQVRRRLMRAAVGAVALVTFKYQPGMAEEFWTKTASQEMLGVDDPRRRLFTWLDENTTTRNKRGLSEVAYCLYVAGAWNAFAEGRTLKLLKVVDTAAPIRLVGTPYQGGSEAP